MLKKVLKFVIVFIVLILIFNILLFITSLFPSSWIRENVEESADTLFEEGNHKTFEYLLVSIDNCTDAFMINMAYSIDNTEPMYSYMLARKNYDKNITELVKGDPYGNLVTVKSGTEIDESFNPTQELKSFLNGDINLSITYTRYWHGWLAIYRVLLIFFNLVEIRKLQLAIFIILYIWLLKLIKEKIGILECLIFAIGLISINYFIVSFSLADTPVCILMMIASIILLKRDTKIKNLCLFFFIIGCITNFIDFLRTPIISLGIPMLLYVAYTQKCNKKIICKDYVKKIIKMSIAWGVGYAATWISKWIIYDFLYDENCIKSAIQQIFFRSAGKTGTEPYSFGIVMAMLLGYSIIIISLMVIMYTFWIMFKCLRGKKINVKCTGALTRLKSNLHYLFISAMPIAWYIALHGHTISSGHIVFVYRNIIIFTIGVLLFLKNVFIVEE